MAVPEVIEAIDAQLRSMKVSVEPDSRTQGPRESAHTYATGQGLTDWNGKGYTDEIVVELTVKRPSSIRGDEPVLRARAIAREFITWLKAQKYIGDMLIYRPTPLQRNVEFTDENGSVIMDIRFEVCEPDEYARGAQ